MKDIFRVKKGTIRVTIAMVIIAIVGLTYAWNYYDQINNSEDPRVLEAKRLYKSYDQMVVDSRYDDGLLLLDSMVDIYNQYQDYRSSYEMGVVLNNKSAIYLTLALQMHDGPEKDSLINKAEYYVDTCITIYENWLSVYGDMSEVEIRKHVTLTFQNTDYPFERSLLPSYIDKRVKDFMLAQRECIRRLSVSYTNQGMVYRNQNQLERALTNYKKAIELWDKNLTAENNINLILGRPLKERTILERLFPDKK